MSDTQMSNGTRVIISADDAFGYYVKTIAPGQSTIVEAFRFTLWGARKKAEEVAARLRAGGPRDSTGRPIVHEIAV